ncbi:ATP-binding protein [Dolichospermum sp. ST_con]|nr:ATP-binding protein [Dolichospermum sp. ST_con]MDD1420193.1 ATP-binding protein [Dolichospermum sp. ST_sed1]MDD1425975.1 ATP-binding protein [Dolichospermum sp. ST_sed9]MDD1432443.1 ATP-binding protein [Dolichospermum sp. ST_sed6]MDD1436069.1 ATP-binding protein [Dolichospermum sp. ST_sed10]MDD1441821.1 ATP-binding protein [Dolichospermum sp. ST_sed3]MDD1445353.1 ATP-binding protein [Dolichospermum sp. ST_sed8]MDD1454565.1 ATP-binding protein [Dolichospermum sp. ST_sed7]MDD1461698.1 ATP-
MLIEFQVGNFLSFKDTVTFSMVASDIQSQNAELDENNVFSVNEELKLLKTTAIYGANASGKSNLAKAFGFMKDFVINSSKEMQFTDDIAVEPFRLSTETEDKPSFFQAIFYINKKNYKYGFKVSQNKVVQEWLFFQANIKEYQLFQRNGNKFKINKKSFQEGLKLADKTKHNSLFLSVVAQFNGKISAEIIKWFANCQVISGSGIHDNFYKTVTLKLLESPLIKKDSIKLIKDLDLSIQDINITKEKLSLENLPLSIPDESKSIILRSSSGELSSIQTSHEKYNENGEIIGFEKFDLEENESEGTKKLFYFSALLLHALRFSQILIIDELDAKLHPIITHKIIELFNSKKYNSKSAQLIFMTHDTNLLNPNLFGGRLLRRDQIWFTEKNQQGATDLYSLAEYDDIAEDDPLEADYIRGRYGAIPFIGNFKNLLSND